jgi:Rhodopirellula transposase DDE domain
MGRNEKYIPVGIVDEDSGQLYLSFGSSHKTSDLIVDSIDRWWLSLSTTEQDLTQKIQIKVDNGSESSGVRTQFLYRMVEFAQRIGKSIQLLYYPPYHSKYNPIERCWGILEQHWNGAKLINRETMLAWAQSMTWKGIKPVVYLSLVTYATGISLSKPEMRVVEQYLKQENAFMYCTDIKIGFVQLALALVVRFLLALGMII